VKKEERDVERLEGSSLKSLFFSLLGNLEQRQEKEKQEALAARLKYETEMQGLSALKQELEACKSELESLADGEEAYKRVYQALRQAILESPERSSALLGLEEKRRKVKGRLSEIREARTAGEKALEKLEAVQSALSSAEGWGTWDLLGGGILADAIKYSRLDEAEAGIRSLQTELDRFQRELSDVDGLKLPGTVNVDGFLCFADYFFDGLIADSMVLSRIRDAEAGLKELEESLRRAMEALEKRAVESEQEMEKLRMQIDALMEN